MVEILKYKLEILKAVLISKNVAKSRGSISHDNDNIIQRLSKYLRFKVKKRNTRKSCVICSKLTIKTSNNVTDVVLVSLLVTLNLFNSFFWCFYCWLWAFKTFNLDTAFGGSTWIVPYFLKDVLLYLYHTHILPF